MDELPLEIPLRETAQLLSQKAEGAQPNLRLIDVREPDEYEICHLPGSELIPLSQFAVLAEPKLGTPAAGQRLLVYCHHGRRSMRATEYLRQKGYAGAQSVEGGIDQWSLEIDPAVPRY